LTEPTQWCHYDAVPTFRSTPVPDAAFIQLAPGLAAESPIRLEVTDWEGFDLELLVAAVPGQDDRAGRFVCEALTVRQRAGGLPVTSEVLRGVPVATLIRGVGSRYWQTVDVGEQQISFTDARLTDEIAARLREQGPTSESLTWVARAYRLALVLGDSPTQAVEQGLGLPRSTAGRWVALARQQGLLGAAEGPGKAGG
jgi:hypothetical protein